MQETVAKNLRGKASIPHTQVLKIHLSISFSSCFIFFSTKRLPIQREREIERERVVGRMFAPQAKDETNVNVLYYGCQGHVSVGWFTYFSGTDSQTHGAMYFTFCVVSSFFCLSFFTVNLRDSRSRNSMILERIRNLTQELIWMILDSMNQMLLLRLQPVYQSAYAQCTQEIAEVSVWLRQRPILDIKSIFGDQQTFPLSPCFT